MGLNVTLGYGTIDCTVTPSMPTYTQLKSVIPPVVRRWLRPIYIWWGTRGFTVPTSVTIVDGRVSFQIMVDPQNGAVDTYIYMHRQWETYVSRVLQEYLRPGGVYVDVGANIGAFVLQAAALVGPTGRVIAFEPIPRLCAQMEKSIQANGFEQIEVRNKAVGTSVGTLQLGIAYHNVGGSAVGAVTADEYITVPVVPLDSELASLARLDVLKIDVEGFEPAVLAGAEAVIARLRPVIILEYSPAAYEASGTAAAAVLDGLEALGYQFTILQYRSTKLSAARVRELVGLGQVDVLCTVG